MRHSFCILLAALGFPIVAHAQYSAYLPVPGEFSITPSYLYQTYDEFWMGERKVDLGAATGFSDMRQHSVFLTFEYGILDWLAADATIGHSWSEFRGGPDDSGLSDTTIGLRAALLSQEQIDLGWPALAIRVGGILPGTYDEAFPFSAGDGAGGLEASLLWAKEICPGFGIYGDIGYRWRNHDVPEDLFGSAGLQFTYDAWALSLGYRHTQSLDGGDIGGPGFMTTYGFPQTKEKVQNLEASLGYTDAGGRYYNLFYAHTIDGRNTGQKDIIGFAITFPLGGGSGKANQAAEVPSLGDLRK